MSKRTITSFFKPLRASENNKEELEKSNESGACAVSPKKKTKYNVNIILFY